MPEATSKTIETPMPPELSEEEKEQVQQARFRTASAFINKRGQRYRYCRLANFDITCPEQQQVVDKLQEFASNLKSETENGCGVVLYGPSGTGKDHLMVALAISAICRFAGKKTDSGYCAERCTQDEYEVVWQSGTELYADLRDAISGNFPEFQVLSPLIQADILILSDPLPPDGELTRYQREILYRILDARYSQRLVTWATLNAATGSEVSDRMGVPCYDRLRHDALCLHCNWPSYRKGRT